MSKSKLKEYWTLPSLQLVVRLELPEHSAVYFAITQGSVLYIGLASNLRNRWQDHHRLPQLEAINEQYEVRLFWLSCEQNQLAELERQYIKHYQPVLNNSKVPTQRFAPSSKMLSMTLKKLSNRVIGIGICEASSDRLKTLFLGYLAAPTEIRQSTTTVRKTLQSVNKKPNSLLRWIETVRRRDGAHWRTRCNGMEVQLLPLFGERLMHSPSLYDVMLDQRFGRARSVPMADYKTIKAAVRAMTLKERLQLALGSKLGLQQFPLECGSQFRLISSIEILCLRDRSLQIFLPKATGLRDRYSAIRSIESDPIPHSRF